LIIMDEPTSSLTSNDVKLLFKVIKSLAKEGISILFISHKIDEVLRITDRITVLRDGKKIGTFTTKDLDYNKVTYLMTSKEITNSRYIFDNTNRKVLIEIKNLSKRNNYKDISFKLFENEILGISGLLGSGRTEIALSLFGITAPDSGEIYMNDRPVKINSPIEAIRNGISYVPEDRINQGLILDYPIGDNIVSTKLRDVLNRLKLINKAKKEKLVNYWVDKLKIKCTSSDAFVQTLSGGNQQRVVLAKWLITEPRIFILDNPTAGIDVAAKDEIHKLIKQLAKQGIGIILISDEDQELLSICSRIITMHRGRIIKETIVKEDTKI
jgi:simple sugar transport system ATP-binding protein